MKEVTVQQLQQWRVENKNFQLIDVRELHEYAICNMGGENIPLGDVQFDYTKIKKDIPVVVHCRSGKRSATGIEWLEANEGYDNLYNLKGGILEWIKEIDPSLTPY